MLYVIELPLIVYGLHLTLKSKSKLKYLILGWLLLAPIPGGVARETPHALRTLQVLPIPHLLSAISLVEVRKKSKKIFVLGLAIFLFLFINYLDIYHNHYREHWSSSWQYGYKQLVDYVSPIANQYDTVYITQSLGRPHTYFLLYTQKDPEEYVMNRDAGGDAFGFTETYGYDNLRFTDPPESASQEGESWLVVVAAQHNNNLDNAKKSYI